MEPYNRSNPSRRYRDLIGHYRQMHREGERFLQCAPEETFPGKSLLPHVRVLKELIESTGALTLLDYGAGKGLQYRPRLLKFEDEPGAWESIADSPRAE